MSVYLVLVFTIFLPDHLIGLVALSVHLNNVYKNKYDHRYQGQYHTMTIIVTMTMTQTVTMTIAAIISRTSRSTSTVNHACRFDIMSFALKRNELKTSQVMSGVSHVRSNERRECLTARLRRSHTFQDQTRRRLLRSFHSDVPHLLGGSVLDSSRKRGAFISTPADSAVTDGTTRSGA